jgi:hypothetical protein
VEQSGQGESRGENYIAVFDHVVELLRDPRQTAGEILAEIEHLMQTAPAHHRRGRRFARHNRSTVHRLRCAKYGKRLLA